MRLVFTDSNGKREIVAEADDFQELIEPMMAHKAKRHIYTSGPISFPGHMEPGSAYILNQEETGLKYVLEDTRVVPMSQRASSPICDVCNAN